MAGSPSLNRRLGGIALIGGFLLVFLVVVLWRGSVQAPQEELVGSMSTTSSTLPPRPIQEQVEVPPLAEEKVPLPTEPSVTANSPLELPTAQPEAKARLEQVAKAYEESLKFPMYSRPITTEDHALLHPYEFVPTSRAFPGSDLFSYDVLLPRMVFFRGQPIPLTLRIQAKGQEPIPQMQWIKAELWEGNQIRAQTTLAPQVVGAQEAIFGVEFNPSEAESEGWGRELGWKISFLMNGFPEIHSMTFFWYENSVARLVGLEAPRVEGPHLILPLKLKVKEMGRYKATANLYSETSQQPIAHLIARQTLEALEGTLLFQVHASVLRQINDSGPYRLQDIWVSLLPEEIGPEPRLANPEDLQFSVPAQDLTRFSHEAHVDPDEQQKLKQFQEWINENQ